MNTKSDARGMVSRLQKVLLAALVLVVAFGSLPTGEAHAWAYGPSSGKPGAVSVPIARIGDTLLPGLLPTLRIDSAGSYIYAYRSPATSGDQRVAVQYILEGWTGSAWVVTAPQDWYYGVIRAGQNSIAFPPLNLIPSNFIRGYYYRVTWVFAWASSTGTSLGGRQVVSNLATDHKCVTTRFVCTPYVGSVLIR